jgi:phage gp16-like protein
MTRDPLLAQIHCARRDMALDDGTYRAILTRVTGQDSAKGLSEAQRRAVLDEFGRLGWAPGRPKAKAAEPRRDHRFVLVLWSKLAGAGHVKAGRAALNAFISSPKFAAKWGDSPTDLRFLPWDRTRDVIEALKDLCQRHQVRLER